MATDSLFFILFLFSSSISSSTAALVFNYHNGALLKGNITVDLVCHWWTRLGLRMTESPELIPVRFNSDRGLEGCGPKMNSLVFFGVL
ncbi:hypothetical protein NL676_039297 [Syzygium grande]|nr:hypothetical protein NL676_039297 [Syzygium grande]